MRRCATGDPRVDHLRAPRPQPMATSSVAGALPPAERWPQGFAAQGQLPPGHGHRGQWRLRPRRHWRRSVHHLFLAPADGGMESRRARRRRRRGADESRLRRRSWRRASSRLWTWAGLAAGRPRAGRLMSDRRRRRSSLLRASCCSCGAAVGHRARTAPVLAGTCSHLSTSASKTDGPSLCSLCQDREATLLPSRRRSSATRRCASTPVARPVAPASTSAASRRRPCTSGRA